MEMEGRQKSLCERARHDSTLSNDELFMSKNLKSSKPHNILFMGQIGKVRRNTFVISLFYLVQWQTQYLPVARYQSFKR